MKQSIGNLLYWIAHRYCPDMVWNSDMSLEIDRLHTIIDQLRERLAYYRQDISE